MRNGGRAAVAPPLPRNPARRQRPRGRRTRIVGEPAPRQPAGRPRLDQRPHVRRPSSAAPGRRRPAGRAAFAPSAERAVVDPASTRSRWCVERARSARTLRPRRSLSRARRRATSGALSARDAPRDRQPRARRVAHRPRSGARPQRGPDDAARRAAAAPGRPTPRRARRRPARRRRQAAARLGHALVERPHDRAASRRPSCRRRTRRPGTVVAPKRSLLHDPVQRPGSARCAGTATPLSCSARSTAAQGCEAGRAYSTAAMAREHNPAPCSSSSTSATRRPTWAPSAARSWSTTGASPPCASRPRTSSAPRCATCSRCATSASSDLDASILSSTVPQLRPEWTAMAERYLGHEMPVVGPGVRTGMPIRMDNPREVGADRLVNAVAAYERVGGPCVIVDFGTAITYDCVSAAGEYVGGIIAPGVEISMEALTSRAAAIPQIDLTPPRALIGKSTVEAIRSGVIYGFAAQVDGIVARLREELGEETEAIATGGLAGAIVPFCDLIDDVDDLLTLTGLRLIHERNDRTAARLEADALAARPLGAGRDHDPEPRRARAAGRHRQLVRAPAGQALRRRASRSARWSRATRSTTATARRSTSCSSCTPTSAPAGRSRSSSSARTRRSCAPPRPWPPSAGADLIDLNMGCPVPKVMKTGAGAALIRDPDTAVAVARAAREGSGLPVTVKLRAALKPGGVEGFEVARRLVEDAGVAGLTFHPRSAAVRHKGTPDYELAARLVEELPVPVIVSGGMEGAEHIRAVFESTGCAAVMLARGALGNPWLFAQVLGTRSDEPTPRRGRSPSGAGCVDRAVEHLGPGARRALPAQVPPLVRRAPRRGQGGRKRRRGAHPRGVRVHRLRGGHARPRRARQPVAVRAGAGHARRRAVARGDPRRVALGRRPCGGASRARARRALPAQVPPLVRRAARRGPRRAGRAPAGGRRSPSSAP